MMNRKKSLSSIRIREIAPTGNALSKARFLSWKYGTPSWSKVQTGLLQRTSLEDFFSFDRLSAVNRNIDVYRAKRGLLGGSKRSVTLFSRKLLDEFWSGLFRQLRFVPK